MQAIKLTIEDSIYSKLMGLLEILPKGSVKVEKLENEYDYSVNCPSELLVSSVEEVRRRVYAAEERIAENGGLSEEEYEKRMKIFFKEELGIER